VKVLAPGEKVGVEGLPKEPASGCQGLLRVSPDPVTTVRVSR
jgi:hypothetical protein